MKSVVTDFRVLFEVTKGVTLDLELQNCLLPTLIAAFWSDFNFLSQAFVEKKYFYYCYFDI